MDPVQYRAAYTAIAMTFGTSVAVAFNELHMQAQLGGPEGEYALSRMKKLIWAMQAATAAECTYYGAHLAPMK